jgi:hypothetical protein
LLRKIIQKNNDIIENENDYNNSSRETAASVDYIVQYSVINDSLGSSLYGQITPIILQSIRIILAMIVLNSLNIINVIEFRKRYSNRLSNITESMKFLILIYL